MENLEGAETPTLSSREIPVLNPPTKIMFPVVYDHQTKYLVDPPSDDEYFDYYDQNYDMYDEELRKIETAPRWLRFFLFVGYILVGAILVQKWDQRGYLETIYYYFIILTITGFEHIIPANMVVEDSPVVLALCSSYLIFGIALLAMCFNLDQDGLEDYVKTATKTFGIFKGEDSEDEDEMWTS